MATQQDTESLREAPLVPGLSNAPAAASGGAEAIVKVVPLLHQKRAGSQEAGSSYRNALSGAG